MNAPDKLFLHPNHKGEVGANWLTFSLTNEDEAYIRKDALIEWAKKNNERINTEDGDYTLGYVSAMIDLIEKINSM